MKATPKEYAKAMELLLKTESIEALNEANHMALESKQITLAQFQAGARVLAKAYMNR